MNITIDGRLYNIRFRFDNYVERGTYCIIKSEPDIYGVTICKKPDQFRKTTGRKKALTLALKYAKFTKDQRRQAWEQYWKAMPRR